MSTMSFLQEGGMGIAIIFALIGYVAWKHDYKIFAIIMFVIAFAFFILHAMGYTAYTFPR